MQWRRIMTSFDSQMEVTLNFIKTHGRDKYIDLMESFEQNVKTRMIAIMFNVSPKCIEEWKSSLIKLPYVKTAPPKSAASSQKRATHRFIKKHGREKYDRLMELFDQNIGSTTIAAEFNVTHERVRKWRRGLLRLPPKNDSSKDMNCN